MSDDSSSISAGPGLPTAQLLVQLLAARDPAEFDRLLDMFDHSDTVRAELDEAGNPVSVDVSALLAGAHAVLDVAVQLGAKSSGTSQRKIVAALHHRFGLAVPRG